MKHNSIIIINARGKVQSNHERLMAAYDRVGAALDKIMLMRWFRK